jgi:predicted DNA-binding protein
MKNQLKTGMAQRSLRLRAELKQQVGNVATERGYRSSSAFMVEAIEEKLYRIESVESMSEAEARIAATFNRILREVRSLHTSMQAQFALTDALTKYVLTCMVEPPADVLEASRMKARSRYDRLLRSAARTITGQTGNALHQAAGNLDEGESDEIPDDEHKTQ